MNIPAFPSKQKALMIKSEHVGIASEYEFEHNGMTLRDYFAAKAMQPINSQAIDYAKAEASDMARKAYMIADAMLKAREA